MRADYSDSLNRLLAHEGGYCNDAADPGGPTKYGITIIDYRKYAMPGATAADVKAMPLDAAKRIYEAKYWGALACDALPAGVDYSVFDYGVNSGNARAGRVLRRLCGLTDADWRVTPDVLAALKTRDPKMVIAGINNERLAFLRRLKTWPVFGKGWARRVAEVNTVSLSMAAHWVAPSTAPLPPPLVPAPGKGQVPTPVTRDIATKGAPAATVGAGALLFDWVSAHPLASGLLVAGVVAAIIFAVRAIEQRRAAAQIAATPGIVPVPELPPVTVSAPASPPTAAGV